MIGPCFGCVRERSVEPVGGGEYLCARCIAQRKKGFPAGGAMESTAGGRNGTPTATVSPESLPPQLLIQDGELLVRVGGRAPVPLTTWLARWLAREARAQRAKSAEIRPIPGDAGDAANGGVAHGR
jgi:hypothetical protein